MNTDLVGWPGLGPDHPSEEILGRQSQPGTDHPSDASQATRAGNDAGNEDAARKEDAWTNITYVQYRGEQDLENMLPMITAELSEPYTIYTYRFFVNNWPELCWLALMHGGTPDERVVGCVVGKLEPHHARLPYPHSVNRGYVGMICVLPEFRGMGVAFKLVTRCLDVMRLNKAQECCLEVEYQNKSAMRFYEKVGFVKQKHLVRYYLNGHDAFRYKFLFPEHHLMPLPHGTKLKPNERVPPMSELLRHTEREEAEVHKRAWLQKLTAMGGFGRQRGGSGQGAGPITGPKRGGGNLGGHKGVSRGPLGGLTPEELETFFGSMTGDPVLSALSPTIAQRGVPDGDLGDGGGAMKGENPVAQCQ